MSIHKDVKRNTWYVKHQNKTKRGFKTKKEAQKYEAQLTLNKSRSKGKEDEKPKLKPNPKPKQIMFYKLLASYLNYKKQEVQYTSYTKYEEIVRLIIKPIISDQPLIQIDACKCWEFREKVNELNKSTSYKNLIIMEFKEIMQFAVLNNWVETSPAANLIAFKKTVQEIADQKNKDGRIWDYQEFQKFIKEVEGKEYQVLFVILFNTGMRLGEGMALTWKDLQNSELSVTKSYTKKTTKGFYEIKIPKTPSSIRKIKINKSLNSYLLEYKALEMKKKDFSEDWFICGETRPLPETTVQRRKNAAVKKSGVRNIKIHDFRHSHASILIANGMNIVSVSKRLGHSSVNMTLKVYAHLLEKTDNEMLEFIEKSSHNLLTDEAQK